MSENRFDISLPGLYKENWREAYRAEAGGQPRLSSYQAPEGKPIPFIYKNLDFSGGQAVDTAEYPFFGLWSHETLNYSPQAITVHGYLRGEYYLRQRAAFLDALTVPTSDAAPGFFDHPLWGRFKVVVENYTVSESANESGQCEISLAFKRAGVSLETRAQVALPKNFIDPQITAVQAADKFAKIKTDYRALLQAFGAIKGELLAITGRIQAAQTVLNTITNEIAGISNLIAQAAQAPGQLARMLVNAVFSITGAVLSISESDETLNEYLAERNRQNIAVMFLSAYKGELPVVTATPAQEETKAAAGNLYRTVSLCAAAKLLMDMKDITREKMAGYLALYEKLENSVSLEDPDLYAAITGMRSALAETLRQNAMSGALTIAIAHPAPLLYLVHTLGCDEGKLRAMNSIEDSFAVSGEVLYV